MGKDAAQEVRQKKEKPVKKAEKKENSCGGCTGGEELHRKGSAR